MKEKIIAIVGLIAIGTLGISVVISLDAISWLTKCSVLVILLVVVLCASDIIGR